MKLDVDLLASYLGLFSSNLHFFLFREIVGLSSGLKGWENLDGLKENVRHSLDLVKDLRHYLSNLPPVEEKLKKLLEEVSVVSEVLRGRSSDKGGERILREALSVLPPEVLLEEVETGAGRVEFAIRLPDDRSIPLDSKFVEKIVDEKILVSRILSRTKELRKYLEDSRAADFALAAVPDGVYPVIKKLLTRALARDRVLIVPYSQTLSFILLLLAISPKLKDGFYSRKKVIDYLFELEKTLPQQEKLLRQLFQKNLKIFNLLATMKAGVLHGRKEMV